MEIDNSAANEFRTCPLFYYQGRLKEGAGLELKPRPGEIGPYDLGTRIHELLEEHYSGREQYPASTNEALEIEAQMIIAAYKAKYPQEGFEIVDVERTFRIQLPVYCQSCYRPACQKVDGWYCEKCVDPFQHHTPYSHVYTGKIDLTFRENGKLNIMDAKSQKPRSSSNHPKKWAAKDQASLYLWAAEKIYGEEIGNFYVNVLQRPSGKLQEGPVFPERQRLERTKDQIEIAVRNIVIEADNIERYQRIFGDAEWPSNKEACTKGTWGDCEFYLPCTYGWDPLIREQKYQPKTPYLNLGGVPILQP